MKLVTFIVPDALDGRRADAVATKMLPQYPARQIMVAFDRRDVKLDGLRIRRETPLPAKSEMRIYLSDDCPVLSPDILYEDEHILVVFKPIGISCEVDEQGGLTIGEWLFQVLADKLAQEPLPCHRLDNPTDGLLMLAKDEATRQTMEAAFRERLIHKKYICLVRDTPAEAHAILNAYLRKDAATATVRIFNQPVHGAMAICTEYRVLEAGHTSRLEIALHTGRTHQIRAQMAYIGHPLLGDDKYGDRTYNRQMGAKRLMLTATELTFSLVGTFEYLNELHFSITPRF